MDLGVQLFGVLANTEIPAAEVFSRLKEAGYTCVEPCLALNPIGSLERVIWPLAEFDGYMEMLAKQGLKVNSVHIFGKTLNAHAPELQRLAEKWGIRAFVVKVPGDPSDLLRKRMAKPSVSTWRTCVRDGWVSRWMWAGRCRVEKRRSLSSAATGIGCVPCISRTLTGMDRP